MDYKAPKIAALLGSASFLTMANAAVVQAQQMAQAPAGEIPEQVLVTGSLIRGTVAVGVPVTNLSPQDFAQTGALTTADLLKTVPAANVEPGAVATNSGANLERGTHVNLRGLDTGNAPRSLLMIDGVRFPPQAHGLCVIDPSIIPAIAQERIDVLVDGASATYGSDAIAGVINIILKRGYDGAVTQLRYTTAQGGKNRYQASQLWGRTWDGGDITLSYEWYDDSPIQGSAKTSKWRLNFSPWGLDNRIPLASSIPGTISTGAPVQSATFGLGTSGTLGTACSNCFAIPSGTGSAFKPINGGLGPTAAFSGSTLNWATFNIGANTGTNGARNEFDPYSIAWYDAAQQRNAAVATFDQRLTKNITLYGSGFYSNRRSEFKNPANLSPNSTNLLSIAVPTWNPYYPTGGAPSNLRVNYNMTVEKPSFTQAYELSARYDFGLRIDLPGNWTADIYYAKTYDTSFALANAVNKNAVSAALGWTIAPIAGSGTSPGIATWTKPASVPYMNLFCDPTAFQCNSATTLNYVTAYRNLWENFWLDEKGVKADGPLFDLPAGQVKAAIGANYTSSSFLNRTIDFTGAPNLIAPILYDPEHRQVWAVFAQVNVPIIGDANALPLVRKFDLEGSWRHDQYSDVKGTSNPKVAFNWTVSDDLGLIIRGAWGTSFRAPSFGETSPLANNNIQGWNINQIFAQGNSITVNCPADAGSAADRLTHPTVGPAVACNSNLGGLSFSGGSGSPVIAGWRDFVNTPGKILRPEQATNWAVGAEITPTQFLKGLDVQATWYSVKINGVLTSFGNPTTQAFNAGSNGFSYIVPTDLVGVDAACNNNLTPTSCPEFEDLVARMLANPRNPVPLQALTNIYWLNDGGTFNQGWLKVEGVDWTASYDFDAGDYGAFNAGIVGTYYLHQFSQTFPTDPILDQFHTTLQPVAGVAQNGVVGTGPRMRYRARLGWSDGPWSITGFMDYTSHFFHTQNAPPNVNLQCVATGGTIGGGSFPCAINNYSNIEPSYYTFDLSIGYDTGDSPANDYLKHIGIQLVIQNLLDRHPAFEYRTGTGGGNPAAFDILKSDQGRAISLILTKTW